MGDTISNNRNIDCGIPQGSLLGPKLFILYINDICNISRILQFTIFADDKDILYSNIDILYNQINNELNRLHVWFNIYKQSLNICKTNYKMFSNCKSTQTYFNQWCENQESLCCEILRSIYRLRI